MNYIYQPEQEHLTEIKKQNTGKLFVILLYTWITLGLNPAFSITTTIVLQPGTSGKDATVSSKTSDINRNFGTTPDFAAIAWFDYNTNEAYNFRSLIDFDLSSIPSFATITNAKISLFHNATSAINSGQNACCGSFSVLQKITSPWDENTVTWSTLPSSSTINQVVFPAISTTNQDFTNIDVTAMIQDRKNNPSSNFGMMFKLLFELYFDDILLASSDHPDATLHPKLEVTFTTAGQSYLSAAPALLDFGSQPTGSFSSSQNVIVFGSGLLPASGSITVTRTNSNFQVFDNVNGWGASATLGYSSGGINTTLPVRFSPQSPEVASGTLQFIGGGIGAASLPTVSLTGSGAICVTLSPSADAVISSTSPALNFGNTQELNSLAWLDNGQTIMRSLLNFNLSSIPATATIGSAKLSLFYNPTSTEGNGQQYGFFNESQIRRITGAWNENTVTWNNQPPSVETNQVILHTNTSSTQSYPNIDVTQLVNDLRINPGSNGFMLKLTVEQAFQALLFASREHPNSALRPRLNVCYTPALVDVPTFSEWGLIVLGVLLLITGFIQLRKS